MILNEVVRAVGRAALATLDDHIVEPIEMARRFEDRLAHHVGGEEPRPS